MYQIFSQFANFYMKISNKPYIETLISKILKRWYWNWVIITHQIKIFISKMSNLQTTLNRKVWFLMKPSLNFTNEVSNLWVQKCHYILLYPLNSPIFFNWVVYVSISNWGFPRLVFTHFWPLAHTYILVKHNTLEEEIFARV